MKPDVCTYLYLFLTEPYIRTGTMIRLNNDTPASVLQEVKKGNLVTDTFSKTGLVETIEISDDGLYKIYTFNLVTGRSIVIKR
ncbi:hypothetical protein HDE68_004435 [Pedobacter cryoconitis]|uniref:Uncharacterized protein n=1 Tax=Pedobacter cryoconitis TaxID=188932 RepID=A0A7W8ZR43_9SPHI|nr:hypothetical protein [Pedobacter cryoconitis]